MSTVLISINLSVVTVYSNQEVINILSPRLQYYKLNDFKLYTKVKKYLFIIYIYLFIKNNKIIIIKYILNDLK